MMVNTKNDTFIQNKYEIFKMGNMKLKCTTFER